MVPLSTASDCVCQDFDYDPIFVESILFKVWACYLSRCRSDKMSLVPTCLIQIRISYDSIFSLECSWFLNYILKFATFCNTCREENVALNQDYYTSCGFLLAHFFPSLHVLHAFCRVHPEAMNISSRNYDDYKADRRIWDKNHFCIRIMKRRFAFVRLRRPCPRGRRKRRCFASLMALRGRLGKIMHGCYCNVFRHTKYHHSYRQKTEYQARLSKSRYA